jgi:4-carboxymuconolactone decarboxylase
MDKRNHKERYDAGLKTRREVLGAPYVDKAMAGVDEFSQNSSSSSTPTAGTTSGTAPAWQRSTRSILNLRHAVRAGKEHGSSSTSAARSTTGSPGRDQEVFLQVAIYCGVPAAVVAFRCAKSLQSEK